MDGERYLETVRSLIPEIAARAADCEALRRMPDETFKAFQETGLMRAVQPARWGGYELPPPVLYEAVMEVAAACPSSAWFLGVVGVHNWQLGLFPEEAQADVWGEDTSVQMSSSYAPTGKVELAPGGFRLSGRWSFSSGCDHCQWVLLGGIVPGDGPAPDMRTFLVPRSDYAIDDNWHAAPRVDGKKGLASLLALGVVQPPRRIVQPLEGKRQHDAPAGRAAADEIALRLRHQTCLRPWPSPA